MGLSEPELRVELIQGVVDAAIRQAAAGRDVRAVSDYTIAMVTGDAWLRDGNQSL